MQFDSSAFVNLRHQLLPSMMLSLSKYSEYAVNKEEKFALLVAFGNRLYFFVVCCQMAACLL